MDKPTVYSTHTFVLPFTVQDMKNVMKELNKSLEKNEAWCSTDIAMDEMTGEHQSLKEQLGTLYGISSTVLGAKSKRIFDIFTCCMAPATIGGFIATMLLRWADVEPYKSMIDWAFWAPTIFFGAIIGAVIWIFITRGKK